jgi:myo-inositol 2-dehydrogenase/D-chiro-inositol 1-dehydrogenase
LKSINLGLIGLGEMGKIHLRNCIYLNGAKLVAVSDVSAKSLRVAKRAGIKKVYSDYNKLLDDPRIDAVIISLPTFLHAPVAIKAAECGKHILVEKPLARNSNEGLSITSAATRHGVKLMVGYPMRFMPQFVGLKRSLESGILGDVQIAAACTISNGPFFHRTEYGTPRPVPSWWFDKTLTGGGALIDLGSHLVDILTWFFGDVATIRSQLGHRFNMDFEDYAICVMKFKSGIVATLDAGWFAEYHRVQVDVYGTVSHAHAGSKSQTFIDYMMKLTSKRARNVSSGFYQELQHFVTCLSNGISPTPSGQQGLQNLRIIEAAYENTF